MKDERENKPSASKAAQIHLCPGSHKAQQGKPRQSSEAAEKGTRIHTAWEKEDPAGLNDDELGIYEAGNRLLDALIVDWGKIQ